ncbi:hypothetical protein ANO14919_035230 [Xylariales sp. No.14919]|nr:hypothetical protein ANO14919_035230 [Xylariales sp. No.14919]
MHELDEIIYPKSHALYDLVNNNFKNRALTNAFFFPNSSIRDNLFHALADTLDQLEIRFPGSELITLPARKRRQNPQ